MTHDELLLKLWVLPAEVSELQHGAKAVRALRAVVKLHYPKSTGVGFTDLLCAECTGLDALDYPCPTIQAIEKELS